jgi:hypothetical protein
MLLLPPGLSRDAYCWVPPCLLAPVRFLPRVQLPRASIPFFFLTRIILSSSPTEPCPLFLLRCSPMAGALNPLHLRLRSHPPPSLFISTSMPHASSAISRSSVAATWSPHCLHLVPQSRARRSCRRHRAPAIRCRRHARATRRCAPATSRRSQARRRRPTYMSPAQIAILFCSLLPLPAMTDVLPREAA